MAWLTALVEDPKALIAGRYLCKEGDQDQLRAAIKKDWTFMNNYVPASLTIEFKDGAAAEDIAEAEEMSEQQDFSVWALQG